jgi:hypothetical protein
MPLIRQMLRVVITPANVPRLQLVFSYRTGSAGAHTAAPQVDGSALFVLTPFSHAVYALDLTQPEPSSPGATRRRPAASLSACNAVAPPAAG